MIFKLNNKGITLKELILISLVISLVIIGITYGIVMVRTKEQFSTFRSSALNLGKVYLFEEGLIYDNKIYLGELIELGLSDPVLNPFYKKGENDQYCDNYDSYLELIEGDFYITLQCGSYLIKNEKQNQNLEEYSIFRVSSWQTGEISLGPGEELESVLMYNKIYDSKEQYYRYYVEHTFIRLYNIDNEASFTTIEDIKRNDELIEKTFYRAIREEDI